MRARTIIDGFTFTGQELFTALKFRVLVEMREMGAREGMCLTHAGIGIDGLPGYALSAVLKSLREDGLAFFQKGLWNDDGEMVGAGHGLTAEGVKLADEIIESLTMKGD